jgi:hypothetical protein
MTVIPDDGEGEAGGWQASTTTLSFYRWTSLLPESWTCTISVEMPIRAKFYGTISPGSAASMTAGVASVVASNLMHRKPELPPGIFCVYFKSEMINLFPKTYPNLGESIK